MKVKGSRRLIKRLGLALAVASVVTPTAQAVRMEVGEGLSVRSRQYADDLRVAESTSSLSIRQYADDRREAAPTTSVSILARQYADDIREPVSGPSSVAAPAVLSEPNGFDWGDAGIGALVASGFVLLGTGVMFMGRHSRKGRLAAA